MNSIINHRTVIVVTTLREKATVVLAQGRGPGLRGLKDEKALSGQSVPGRGNSGGKDSEARQMVYWELIEGRGAWSTWSKGAPRVENLAGP